MACQASSFKCDHFVCCGKKWWMLKEGIYGSLNPLYWNYYLLFFCEGKLAYFRICLMKNNRQLSYLFKKYLKAIIDKLMNLFLDKKMSSQCWDLSLVHFCKHKNSAGHFVNFHKILYIFFIWIGVWFFNRFDNVKHPFVFIIDIL